MIQRKPLTVSATVFLSFFVLTMVSGLSGCPKRGETTNCTPFVHRCVGNHGEVCSADHIWVRMGDLDCNGVPNHPDAVCIVNDHNRAQCVTGLEARIRDGGTE